MLFIKNMIYFSREISVFLSRSCYCKKVLTQKLSFDFKKKKDEPFERIFFFFFLVYPNNMPHTFNK